ncbi:MAG: hypothetical protein U0T36_13475 [Saprospiraceae bacterium]
MASKITKPSSDEVLGKLASIMVPKDYLNNFSVVDVKEYPDRWQVELEEHKENIPDALKEAEGLVVLDGFCDSISIVSHCFSLKEVVLRVKRRRWKLSKANKDEMVGHFSNTYELHPNGAKITKELASFLKGENRKSSR